MDKDQIYDIIQAALNGKDIVAGQDMTGYDDNQRGMQAITNEGRTFTIIIIDEDASE